MVKKKHSFDAMVKYFMQNYGIPTRKDIEKVVQRLDQLEKLLKSMTPKGHRRSNGRVFEEAGQDGEAAYLVVFDVIRAAGPAGAGIQSITKKTGFDVKKIRNAIYRLYNLDKIRRRSRGTYVTAEYQPATDSAERKEKPKRRIATQKLKITAGDEAAPESV